MIEDGSSGEERMEDPVDDPVGSAKEELFIRLTDALARDAPFSASTSIVASRAELKRQVRSLIFERDLAWALMLTTLTGRDTTFAERDATFVARDAAIVDRDAHRDYVDEVVSQARQVLEHQDGNVRRTLTLLRHIDALE